MPKFLYLILSLVLFASCTADVDVKMNSKSPYTPNHPAGKVNVGFLVVDGVYNSELMAPYDIFHHTVFHSDSGMNVFTVASSKDIITTFEGIRLLPDYSFDNAPNIDILVVPSAEGSMGKDLEDARMMRFVRERGQSASHVLSLCDGAFLLAQVGLLQNRECTTFPGDIAVFREQFPRLSVHDSVSFVHHDKVITSAGGALSYDPSLYLVEHIYGKEVAHKVGKGMALDWDLGTIKYLRVVGKVQSRRGMGVAFQSVHTSYILGKDVNFFKADLASIQGIEIIFENSKYNQQKHEIIQFTLSTTVSDSFVEATSYSDKLTAEQKEIIGSATSGSKIYLEKIEVKDVDGKIHNMGTEVFTIQD